MNISAGRLTALVAAALLVPAGLAAQGHQEHHPEAGSSDAAQARPGMMPGSCPMMSGGMMKGGAGMMSGMMSDGMHATAMQPGPRMLLRQREALGLTGEQVEKLEQLRTRVEELRSTHRTEMVSVREGLRALAETDDPDLERFESLLRERADLRVRMQVRRAEIHREALRVLDEEQRNWLGDAMGGMRAHGGMSPGGSGMTGMMKGMHQQPGMMQMRQMMKMMHRQMHGEGCPMTPQESGDEG